MKLLAGKVRFERRYESTNKTIRNTCKSDSPPTLDATWWDAAGILLVFLVVLIVASVFVPNFFSG